MVRAVRSRSRDRDSAIIPASSAKQNCEVWSFRSVHTNRPHSGGAGGHFCSRVARLATRQGLLDTSTKSAHGDGVNGSK